MTVSESNPRFGTDLQDGFRVTSSWVAQGIVWLDDIQLFYRERALIENEYASKLNLLAKQYIEKKAARSSLLSVGKTPTISPGSLESASMTTWAIQLIAIETQASKHKEFASQIQTQLVDPLKALQAQYDFLRQVQVTYSKKLEDEKMMAEEEVKKAKSRYDAVCQEVESRRKKADGDSKGKASAAFQQQLTEMHDAKNAYLISIAVANSQQDGYFHEYLPEALDNLQDISESRVAAVNQVWLDAANLELDTMTATSALLRTNLAEIPRNNPKLDSHMFAEHNQTNWQNPPGLAFEPSSVWHDDPSLMTDDRAKNFLRNTLTRSKGLRLEQKSQQRILKQGVTKASTGVQAARKGPVGDKGETEAFKAFYHAQEQLHESTRQLLTAETEISTITAVVGDISLGARSHPFKPDTFKIPITCDFCGDKIWGLSSKGVSCQDCGYTCHAKCEMKSPADCPGEQTKEERKKLKQERQELAHSVIQRQSDSTSVLDRSSSVNLSQRSLTASGSVHRTPSASSKIEAITETEPPVPRKPPVVAAGTRTRRILAPPPTAYVTDTPGGGFATVKGKALYSYEATGSDQITIHENDDLVMVEPDDKSGWIKVRCNLSTGLVPKSYISLDTDAKGNNPTGPPIPARPTHKASASVSSISSIGGKKGPVVAPRRGGKKVRYARALYTYESVGDAMHSITEGEQVVLVSLDASPGWAEIEKDNCVKYVPRDYIAEVGE